MDDECQTDDTVKLQHKLSWQWPILQLLQQCVGVDKPALCGKWDS